MAACKWSRIANWKYKKYNLHERMDYMGGAPSHIAPPEPLIYLETGIANSAPCSMLSDQRCIIDFCLV